VYPDSDGMVVIRGRLTPALGAIVMKALDAARETLYRLDHDRVVHTLPADPPTYGQQQADALGLLAETALHHGMDPGTPAEHYQVVVHVDAPVLADADAPGQSVLEDGARVSAETSQRIACDASRVVMQHDADGRIVDVSARTWTIPPALRRALAHRDPGCRFPGCGLRQTQGMSSERVTRRRACRSIRAPGSRTGTASTSTSAGRSTSCTRLPAERRL
jgi:hypothetical protein